MTDIWNQTSIGNLEKRHRIGNDTLLRAMDVTLSSLNTPGQRRSLDPQALLEILRENYINLKFQEIEDSEITHENRPQKQ